uniref:Uncharacterized protein n=1 Tax=Naja naja TaxID=35670 RepID=A0A8C6XLM6_NAJNA
EDVLAPQKAQQIQEAPHRCPAGAPRLPVIQQVPGGVSLGFEVLDLQVFIAQLLRQRRPVSRHRGARVEEESQPAPHRVIQRHQRHRGTFRRLRFVPDASGGLSRHGRLGRWVYAKLWLLGCTAFTTPQTARKQKGGDVAAQPVSLWAHGGCGLCLSPQLEKSWAAAGLGLTGVEVRALPRVEKAS